MSISGNSSSSVQELDPLLKDLSEKKQNFRRNVVSLAAELKDVRSRLSSQEQLFARETLTRQVVEKRARSMEEEIMGLQKSLEERSEQLQSSATNAEQYLKELDDVRLKLSETEATANENATSAQSAQLQCLVLLKELDMKNSSLKEHEDRVNRLEEQLDLLQRDLQARESSQNQLKDEVQRIELEIMQAVAKAGSSKDCELRKILEEVSPKNIEKINKHLSVKDIEIAKLRDEIRIMSAHWKLKTKELESQMGERRDKALKELRDQLATKKQGLGGVGGDPDKQNFWESSGFKFMVSVSMLILVVFSKRAIPSFKQHKLFIRVTIARAIELADPMENVGTTFIREITTKKGQSCAYVARISWRMNMSR